MAKYLVHDSYDDVYEELPSYELALRNAEQLARLTKHDVPIYQHVATVKVGVVPVTVEKVQ